MNMNSMNLCISYPCKIQNSLLKLKVHTSPRKKKFIKHCTGFHCQVPFEYPKLKRGITSTAVDIGGAKMANNVTEQVPNLAPLRRHLYRRDDW